MPVDVELARQQWEDGHRRVRELAADPVAGERVLAEVDAVMAELRRTIGAAFTLAELAEAYAGSERWLREAIEDAVEHPGWARTVSLAGDAAFHLYARGATDYAP